MEELLEKIKKIVAGNKPKETKLLSICKTIHDNIDNCDWVGFYIVEGRELVLGPYVGASTDHDRIAFGEGICGQAAERLETFVVDDVNKEQNYLSCSAAVKSEIVVPVMRGGKILAELDIDSHKLAAFSEKKEFFENICKEIEPIF